MDARALEAKINLWIEPKYTVRWSPG